MAQQDEIRLPSFIVFGPQSRPPPEEYLSYIRSCINNNDVFKPLKDAIYALPHTWKLYIDHSPQLLKTSGKQQLDLLWTWLETGESPWREQCPPGVLTTPLLVVLQIFQYIQFLKQHHISQQDLLKTTTTGGVHGYCGGFLAAAAIASAADDLQAMENLCIGLRVSVGIGAYSDLVDENETGEANTLVLRLKDPHQIDSMAAQFPKTYVGAVTDPHNVSVMGPAAEVAKFQTRVSQDGVKTTLLDVRGHWHSEDNANIAEEFFGLCKKFDRLKFKNADSLIAPIRSNKTGELISEGSLTWHAIESIMAKQCKWFDVMKGVCEGLIKTGRTDHSALCIGMGDCVPKSAFRDHIQLKTIDALSLTQEQMRQSQQIDNTSTSTAEQEPDRQPYQYPERAVAVVGAACRFPGANNLDEFWNLLDKGEVKVQELGNSRVDFEKCLRHQVDERPVKQKFFGNFLRDVDCFDHEFFGISAREATAMDPQQRLLLEVSYEAMDSSGLLRKANGGEMDGGLFLGIGNVDYFEHNSAHSATAYSAPGTLRAFLAGRISRHLKLTGPAVTSDTACSSSGVALVTAVNAVANGDCEFALTGGVNTISSPNTYLDLAKAGFLSSTGPCKPFDKSADGYCRGEGCGMVVLKLLSRALEDGDQVYGVIPGAALNQSALSSAITVPYSPAQTALYRKVLKQAKMDSSIVEYVEAHGTGTAVGDPIEMSSIREVFGGADRPSIAYVGSVKANIGHLEPCSGIASLIKAILMIKKKLIPPLVRFSALNPKIPPLENDNLAIALQSKEWDSHFRAACVNNYGAAGSNAALLVCQPPNNEESRPGSDHIIPLIVTGRTESSCLANWQVIKDYVSSMDKKVSLQSIGFTLNEKRTRHPYVIAQLASERSLTDMNHTPKPLKVPETTPKVVLVFSGQTDTKIALSRSLFESVELLRTHIEECNKTIIRQGFTSILPAIFQDEPISDLVALHFGLFSVQYSMAKAWVDCGLSVDAVVGHSFGELTAMAVSGVLGLKDAVNIIGVRASLVRDRWSDDAGAMAAVEGPLDGVQKLLEDHTDVGIACYNGPTSFTLSGPTTAVKATAESASQASLKCRMLNVTNAYHSSLVNGLLDDLNSAAADTVFKEPAIRIETCTEANIESFSINRFADHLRHPVMFEAALKRLEKDFGPSVFLEAGFDSVIVPMARKALQSKNSSHKFLAVSGKTEDSPNGLAATTAALWEQRIEVSYFSFGQSEKENMQATWLPPYQFDHSNRFWLPLIDHAYEAHSRLNQSEHASSHTKVDDDILIGSVRWLDEKDSIASCAVNTCASYYKELVKGHTVLGSPLCPAAAYLYMCAAAVSQLETESAGFGEVVFQDLKIESPLNDDPVKVVLELSRSSSDPQSGWNFSLASQPESGATTHATGAMQTVDDPSSSASAIYNSMILKHVQSILDRNDLEVLRANTAYKLFSRVVTYSDALQRLATIQFADNEAVGSIEMGQVVEHGGNPQLQSCDPVLLDNCIQVAGLLINNTSDCLMNEACLATGIDRLQINAQSYGEESQSLLVYAMLTSQEDTSATADVFAISRQTNTVVVTVSGIKFTKVRIEQLRKYLQLHGTPRPSAAASPARPVPARSSLGTLNERGRDPTPGVKIDAKMAESDHGTSTSGHKIESSSKNKSQSDSQKDESNEKLKSIFEQYIGKHDHNIDDKTLDQLGVDSIAMIELKSDLEKAFGQELDLQLDTTILDIRQLVQADKDQKESASSVPDEVSPAASSPQSERMETPDTSPERLDGKSGKSENSVQLGDAFAFLRQSSSAFDEAAKQHRFAGFWNSVRPRQNEVTAAYIFEGLRETGVDLKDLTKGDSLPRIPAEPKHSKLIQRIQEILVEQGYLDQHKRWTGLKLPEKEATEFLASILEDFPQHRNEHRLLESTASVFGECLTGKKDAVKIMFGDPSNSKLLQDVYSDAPMFATLTDVLLDVLGGIVSASETGTVNIIEIGAGLGGTTSRVLELLKSSGRSFKYTFTDISNSFLRKAEAQYKDDRIDYRIVDVEKDPDADLVGRYDIALATNVIHATTDLVKSMSNVRRLLRASGIAILSEITRPLHWYDLVFGLLDGWWNAVDGRSYPLQSPERWFEVLKAAGFQNAEASRGSGEEASMQKLIIGSLAGTEASQSPGFSNSRLSERSRKQTIPYKSVDGSEILADIYFPTEQTNKDLPIALMIHGGGHIMLSRTAIRPYQTLHLLNEGFLPVSLDYRYCPEISIIEGAVRDVCDGLRWVRNELPALAKKEGFTINAEKIVSIGWSTGGHLAMMLASVASRAGIQPPVGVLAFYPPVDYRHQRFKEPLEMYGSTSMTIDEMYENLQPQPISVYHLPVVNQKLGWYHPDDARSQMVLSTAADANTLPFLLRGIQPGKQLQEMPSDEEIAQISPLAELEAGYYRVPTFVIHGDYDELAPSECSEQFVALCREKGIKCGLRIVKGAKHDNHDLWLKPGSREFDLDVKPGYDFLMELMK